MDKYLNIEGYDLCEIKEGEWALNTKGGSVYVSDFKKVVKHAVSNMGFELEEIEFAVNEMLKQDHNGAHFGVYKTFIFTFHKDFKNVQKAG